MVTTKKLVTPKIGYPKKNGCPKKFIKKMVTPKNLAYFITRWFIIAFRKMAYFIVVVSTIAIPTLLLLLLLLLLL